MVNNMSVKDRVSQFEAMAEEDKKEAEKASSPGKPPRFLYPGSKQKEDQVACSNMQLPLPVKPRTSLTGVDLDLEGVWNIRKNVSVAKSKLNQPVYPLTTGSYSRHGAVATKGQSTNSRHDDFSFSPSSVRDRRESVRFPDLAPRNGPSRTWKTPHQGVYSYSEAAKRRRASPTEETTESPPSAKRRVMGGLQSLGREFESKFAPKSTTDIKSNPERDKKLRYAQKMAAGHLRSAGLGEYTPKTSAYRRERDSNDNGYTAKWKLPRDDTDS
ncbi:uncharacterized protein LOC134186401 isoform X2 [Corticium candelabrum]|uniref:uncharacterized protein LOC134186401 isoform X2 n=1 Tax=Corticium candelabrum TaxID=121492 RepID=UPI002E25B8F1|nr:uncharacterized protein LOC134186401 isoform X2 [Corticium candelabrum]